MLPKQFELWMPGLIASARLKHASTCSEPANVYFCLADHYEPAWRNAGPQLQRECVATWTRKYPECASRHADSEGRYPRHTFFFPAEQYRPEHLDALAALCRTGWGDVEIHLHHDNDTAERFEENVIEFATTLNERHGLLRCDADGRLRYAFIHGNWALNNSRPDGRYCGVDDETSILLRTGCYADMTMPCGAHVCQSRKVNSIYYSVPRTTKRAHDTGVDARAGSKPPSGLLMIQGPLGLNWERRKWGLLPRIDYGDVAWHTPPSPDRVRLWLEARVQVEGAPEHIFIKVHTHGAQGRNVQFLLNGGLESLWSAVEDACRIRGHRLHYVSAFEMASRIRELETGQPFTFGLRGCGTTFGNIARVVDTLEVGGAERSVDADLTIRPTNLALENRARLGFGHFNNSVEK